MFRQIAKLSYGLTRIENIADYRSLRFVTHIQTPKPTEKASLPQTRLPDESGKEGPIKFTTSQANIGYKATLNFYGDDVDLPDSHNIVLAGTLILAFFYLIFLRDEHDEGGALSLLRPVHETIPELAVPLLKATIAENKKLGVNTDKLEKRLAEYEKEDSTKLGAESRPKLKEN